MNESVLRALLRLFALITEATDETAKKLATHQVREYLQHKIDASLLPTYITEFEEYLHLFSRPPRKEGASKARKASTLGSVKVIMVCEKINENLAHHEKITVLVRLSEFVHNGGLISFRETNFLETLSRIFNVENDIYQLIQHFVFEHDEPHELLVYAGAETKSEKWLLRKELTGKIIAFLLPGSSQIFVKYSGTEKLRINHRTMIPGAIYLLNEGGIIVGRNFASIHHNELQLAYYKAFFTRPIVFQANRISYSFSGGVVGLHPLSLTQHSGRMVGIMGASGAGKSTLLNILNGNLKPASGSLTINGIPVNHKSAKQLIGYVPQDDLLIEELTVYENLYYNGLLCLPDLSPNELQEKINGLLSRIDLYEVRDLRVGSVLDKRISGGQRKRLNIALELLREPAVLFVDEPTSGLSSQDSEVVMRLLKQLTLKGKLVFAVIHQPSSHIYRLLDQLILLDKGGYPVYVGHALEAPGWFRKKAGYITRPGEGYALEYQVDPDEMLRIVESRRVNEFGRITSERVKSPEEWYTLFQTDHPPDATSGKAPTASPAETDYKTPSRLTQFSVYLKRNLLSKLRNRSFLLIALLEAPVLAIIIGLFTRYAAGTADNPQAYLLFYNKNLPAYLFMIIVVAIFVGMQISAEEIIRDRKILKRESFLNLSWFSYLNSKVIYLMMWSAVQSFLLVFTGNIILGIDGMDGYFFAVLFPTFIFANFIGLNISAAFRSVVTIYILVPFLVVPQLLLSGVIVDFDTLQKPKDQGKVTPVIADLMVARWAYEAMAVAHFKHNLYQRHFFNAEQEKQEALYQFSLRIPTLSTLNEQCLKWVEDTAGTVFLANSLSLLHSEVEKTNRSFSLKFDHVDDLNPPHYTSLTGELLGAWLNEIERQYRTIWRNSDARISEIAQHLAQKLNMPEDLLPLKEAHHNQKLAEHLQNAHELQKIRVIDDVLVRKSDYIYKLPESNWGRAHFYAPVKYWGGKTIDTVWFNMLIIWFFNLILYLMLYFRLFEKAVVKNGK